MSFLQELQGITVLPSLALRRSGLFEKNPSQWPRGYAFGGWVYDANVTLGFSKQPTEITLSIVLENDSSINTQQRFDIHDDLLANSLVSTSAQYTGRGNSAWNFHDENFKGHFYSIDLHGIKFNRMYLFDYSISVEASQKTLAVTLKDYSLIMDKIYVGLMNRQGPHRQPGQKKCDPKGASFQLIRKGVAAAHLKAMCPNCYLTGDGFYRGNKNPVLTKQYGGNLSGFFTPMEGTIYRDVDLGSFIGRVHPLNSNIWEFISNLPKSQVGGQTSRFSPQQYWHYLAATADSVAPIANRRAIGFTMDGGFLMLGTEEFEERSCGNAPNISYNFSELLNSLRLRGIPIINPDGSEGNLGNPAWPDRNPRFRANYIGTLREVLEQWCGIYSLDFYYKDRDNINQGIYFLDLKIGANISPVRDIVDPATSLGKEFGATDEQKSVIVSYKESSTLDNTYLQRVITSNIKPFSVKERKKSVKRYVPIVPLHPLDFATPAWRDVNWNSLLGETYSNPLYANMFPWMSDPQSANSAEDHRKRLSSRTNRELWDVDISIALSRMGQDYRDLYISNRICELSMSEICPVDTYPKGHDREGQAVQYLQGGDGSPGAEASEDQMKLGQKTVSRRLNQNQPKDGSWRPNMKEEKDLKANLEALGFEQLAEVEDHAIKENLVEMFLSKQEVEDISMDISNYKMFIGYYDETTHKEYVAWEQKCAESMYGFGAIMGGTIPAYPFIPRDYFGVMDGQAGFNVCGDGLSIPKLSNSFEPAAAQYPIYSVEQAQRTFLQENVRQELSTSVSTEALQAPFNSILIESGNYLPTGLYIAQLDNPWGKTVEHFQKRFWEKFQDNACREFNDSLNMIQTAGFNREPAHDPPQKDNAGKLITKKASDTFPFKKQDWNLGMFTPKFFKNTDQIFDSADGLIQALYDDGCLVDEVSMQRWSVDYGHQRFCKKISVMIVTDTRLVDDGHGNKQAKHPNIAFDATYRDWGTKNYMARHQRELWEIAEYKRHQKDDIRNRCDYDLLFEFCEDAIQKDTHGTYDPRVGSWGQLDKAACAVDPTGVYKEGFPKELVGGHPLPNHTAAGLGTPKSEGRDNSRILHLTISRNPNNPVFLPTSELGFYHIQDLEEDLEALTSETLHYDIVYPINNFTLSDDDGNQLDWNNPEVRSQTYSGIWTADVTVEDRRPELIEIYGHPPAFNNPTAGIRIVNNAIDPDLEAIMDPDGAFQTQMYDNQGDEVRNILEYHNYIAHGDTRGFGANGLDHYNVISPTKKIELTLAGSLVHFPNFATLCDPVYGLQNLTISLSDQGTRTSLSFADRPPKAPQMEGILNKIGPRTM